MFELWRKTFIASGAQIYSLLVGVVTLTLTARWLGPEGRGIIAAVTTWVSLFSSFGYLSLGQVAIYRATQREVEQWLGPTLGSLLFLDLIITLVAWLVALYIYLLSGGVVFNHLSPVILVVGFIALPLMIWEQYGSALLMAIDHVTIYSRAQVIGRTVGLILILLAWFFNLSVPGVLFAILIAQTVVAFGGIRYLLTRTQNKIRLDRETIRQLLSGAIKLHPNYVGGFLVTSSSILIINYYLGPVETGYYQLAAQLVGVVAIIPQSASMVIYGKVAQLGPDAAWLYQRKFIAILMIGLVVIAGLSALLAPWIIPLMLGSKFSPVVEIFKILLLSMLSGALASAMSSQWIGRGLFSYMSAITVVLGMLSLLGNIVLVPQYGIYGAAWTAVGVYAFALLGQSLMVLKCELSFRHSVLVQESA